jgi:hypothetical protein
LSHALLPCVLYWPQPVSKRNILVFFLDLNLDKVLEKETKTQCLLCQSQWHCLLSPTEAKLYSSRKKWNTDLPEFGTLGSFAAVNQIFLKSNLWIRHYTSHLTKMLYYCSSWFSHFSYLV